MGHLVRAQWGWNHIIGEGRLDGWFPRFMAGHQEYLLYGPAFDWLVALVRALTLARLSDPGAMKVLTVVSIIALGPAVAYLARSFGLSRRAAVLAAILAYVVDNVFGVGVSATFVIGLVPHQVAAPLFCVGLGACWRVLSGAEQGARRAAVCSTAGLVLLHPISLMVMAVMLALAVVWGVLARHTPARAVRELAKAGVVTAGVTAFWLLPYAVHRDLRGPVATWLTPSIGQRWHDIVHGHVLFAKHVVWIVLAGWALAAWGARRTRRWALLAPAVLATAYVLAAHVAHHIAPDAEPSLLLANRGLGYAGLLGVLPLAWSIDRLTAPLARLGNKAPSAAGVAAAVAVVVWPVSFHRVARQQPVVAPALRRAAAVVHDSLPLGSRFAVERDFPAEIRRTGITQPNLWLAYHAGANELNVFNGESSLSASAGYAPDLIHDGDAAKIARRLAPLGVVEVVTVAPATPARLAASGRFGLAWRDGPIAVLRLVPFRGEPAPGSLVWAEDARPGTAARLDASRAEHPRWQITMPVPGTVTLAVAWSPKWSARVAGRQVPVHVEPTDHLVALWLPAGESAVALDYEPDGWERLGRAITVTTLALLALFAIAATARRRRAR